MQQQCIIFPMWFKGEIIEFKKTHEKTILPVFFPPPVNVYLNYSVLSAILFVYPKTYDWFFSNFIQVYSRDFYWFLFQYMPDAYLTQQTQYFLDIFPLTDEVLTINRSAFTDIIIHWLSNAYYVEITLSEYDLPGTMLYQRFITPHNQFIFGYDLQKKCFKVLNFNQMHTLAVLDIPFQDMEHAFFCENTQKIFQTSNFRNLMEREYFRVYKFRLNDEYQYALDPGVVRNTIKQYVDAAQPAAEYGLYHPDLKRNTKDTYWGIDIYTSLQKHLENTEKTDINFLAFYGLWEHKMLMQKRLQYLEEKKILPAEAKHSELYLPLEKQAEALKTLVHKYVIKKDRKIIAQMIDLLQEMQPAEKRVLTKVITDL